MIVIAAATEYDAYLRARETAAKRPPVGSTSARGGVLLPGQAVLAPVLSAVFLLPGYALRLHGAHPTFSEALLTAGWIAAGTAAVTILAAGTSLLVTAARNRTAPLGDGPIHDDQAAARAWEAWQQALPEHGILPFLHRQLQQEQPAGTGRPPLPLSLHQPAFHRA
ncbi:hypothetical protein [Actinacidiphila oryziradicis]|uniref:Uncharacterized protein n=1 Tax=Actinacidiphila oryziradicis TaxID=2571141 RepID=A0A4U0S0M1_9ACTN|nr:hypothetical protein [Actinacidiphila oryziradicis]TKA00601.1 hypothetical protein FCI23_42525 [Actinacidiphila oryziradicis]